MTGVDAQSAETVGTPKRIQRKRTAGWKMPEDAVYVGRGSRWGNPFKVEKVPSWPRWAGVNPSRVVDPTGKVWEWPPGEEPPERAVIFNVAPDYIDGAAYHRRRAATLAVHLFETHVGPMGNYEYDGDALEPLRGHDLACWCPLGEPCHADVLLRLAATYSTPEPQCPHYGFSDLSRCGICCGVDS